MKERPILFQGAMIRSLLADTKTQTRREIKHRMGSRVWQEQRPNGSMGWMTNLGHAFGNSTALTCPYGEPGQRLWVRESWGYFDPDGTGEDFDSDRNDDGPCKVYAPELMQEGHALRNYWRRRIAYKATFAEQKYGRGPVGPSKWRPSIHMPRWASRITLEITDVRVQRLQEISEADARSEGVERDGDSFWRGYAKGHYDLFPDARGSYASLWVSINGAGSWDANPFVWAISFRRIAASGEVERG